MPQSNLETTLAQLENAQLLRLLNEADAAYVFKNALTQETVYESLLRKTRRDVHRRVAETYERLYPDRLDENAALLAQHYAEAGEDAKTLEYATRAGDAAARVYANAEAIAFYARALELSKRAPPFALPLKGEMQDVRISPLQELFLKLGRMYELNSQHDLALSNYAEMESLGRARGDRPLELGALMARATIHAIPSPQFDSALAESLSDQALRIAREIGDLPAQAKILWNVLLLHTRLQSNFERALVAGEQALEIAQKLDLREQLAYVLNDLSTLYVYTGKTERGHQVNQQARELWHELGNLPMLADNLSYEAMNAIGLGEYAQATRAYAQAYDVSQRIGNAWGMAFSLTFVGTAYRELGEIEQAIRVMEEAAEIGGRAFPAAVPVALADLGRLHGDLGQVSRGIELALRAQASAQSAANLLKEQTYAALVHLYLLNDQPASARELLTEAYAKIPSAGTNPIFGVGILLADAECALAQNELARAHQVCDRVIATQSVRRLRHFMPDAFILKSTALLRQGDLAGAAENLEQAHALAERASARWALWRILAALADIETARGNAGQAQSLRARAREIISYIAARTPEILRASFLNLPDVRAVL